MKTWEVDWSHPGNNGSRVWARALDGHLPSAREWHWTRTGYLRSQGVSTPTYRKDSWEVDWSRRNGKLVWARNPLSKFATAAEWHWVDFHQIERAGQRWKPKSERTGRFTDSRGYIVLGRRAMTQEEIDLASACGLFRGPKKAFVMEHRLAAAKKYGQVPPGSVVRHLNGIKTDNRPENIVLGTTQENTMDHNTARLMAMYWRGKYEDLLKRALAYDPSQSAA